MKIEGLELIDKASEVLLGKRNEIKLALVSLISDGHLLIEDIPGVGKTTLVYVLAKIFGLNLSRVQFTNDLLPSDILGTHIFDSKKGEFEFKKGPVFGELILADELNRATPKTQSALLQVMEERRINLDGEEFILPRPYLVIATQNPFHQIGTFPLPESQLDRFFMSLCLDLPDREFEKKIIEQTNIREKIDSLPALLTSDQLLEWQGKVRQVKVADKLSEYVLDILQSGRQTLDEGHFLSPRAGRDLLQAARGHCLLEGRDFVLPEDVQAVAPYVLGHRVGSMKGVKFGINTIKSLIETVSIP
ncbi:MAG: MoxR family ATPase [Halobacteriovoraceae bacterium]|jgi:MoxR-like ATPase|nr:MoxR family ATPase [Halobacteriovoraceae bacterium]MBT5093792.1 MoxR family ATPase [Halobacteriovoraceae bacterium]